jgi:hypothetical protein
LFSKGLLTFTTKNMIKVFLVLLAVFAAASTKDASSGMERRFLSNKYSRRNLGWAPAGKCFDSSAGECDSYGDCCDEYHSHKYWCGAFDTSSFKSNEMCCACGGGTKPVAHKLMDANGSTRYPVAYWAKKCRDVPAAASYITVKMGNVIDHFKPLPGKSMCDMLTSDKNHMWAQGKDPNNWRRIGSIGNNHLGGTAFRTFDASVQKELNDGGDTRTYVSYWGDEGNGKIPGGCCYYGYTDAGFGWRKSYTMYYNIVN